MSLFAIGDLHLHFQSELKAPGQLHEPVWKNHEEIFRKNCERLIGQDDTLVLVGDHSWGRNLRECEQDLEYIVTLPGRKVLLRGNHDMFWDAKKTEILNLFLRRAGRWDDFQRKFQISKPPSKPVLLICFVTVAVPNRGRASLRPSLCGSVTAFCLSLTPYISR